MHTAGPFVSDLSCLAWEIPPGYFNIHRHQSGSITHSPGVKAGSFHCGAIVGMAVSVTSVGCVCGGWGVSASLFLDKCPGLILRHGHYRQNFLFVLWFYQLDHVEFPQQGARVSGSSTQAPDQLPAFFICLAVATLVPWTASHCGFLYFFLSQPT